MPGPGIPIHVKVVIDESASCDMPEQLQLELASVEKLTVMSPAEILVTLVAPDVAFMVLVEEL